MASSPLTHCPQYRTLMNKKWPACAVCGSQAGPTPQESSSQGMPRDDKDRAQDNGLGKASPIPPEAPLTTSTPAAVATPHTPDAGRSYRQWVTGTIPQTTTTHMAEPLPPPKYHDIPSPCRTYLGTACATKACQGNRVRFQRTGLCARCWERAKKVTVASEATW
jgi:hypothetical protein